MKDAKWIKTKIGVGSIMTEIVIETEKNIREGIIRRTNKEVVGCIQTMLGKTNLLVKI